MWDVTANKKVNTLEGHSARVGALAWNGDSLSSGSRDRLILQRDVRTPSIMPERRMVSLEYIIDDGRDYLHNDGHGDAPVISIKY